MPDFVYRPLAYTGPISGNRLEFIYNGVIADGVSHNLGEFDFAGVDEKYYQDRSIKSDAFAFTLMINDQSVLRATRALLEEKAKEKTPGTLEHPDPTIGSFPAVVAGFKVTQNSVKGRGIARIVVTFFRAIPNLLGGDPSESDNPASAAASRRAIDELNEGQASDFANSVNDSTGTGFAALVNGATSAVQAAQDHLGTIAANVDSVNILFTNTVAEVISTVDELARSPHDLARQIQNIIQLPMLAVDSFNVRLSAYQDYVDDVISFSTNDENEFAAGSPSGTNILSVAGMSALAAVSAINYAAVTTKSVTLDEIIAGEAVTESGYLSRLQIIDAIMQIQNNGLLVTDTMSQKAADFGASTFFSQYFDYSILNKNLITATIKNLNSRIFSTAREVTIIQEGEENPIPVCGRLYGSVNINTIDFFLESNNLRGDEIFLIPHGKELVYYV